MQGLSVRKMRIASIVSLVRERKREKIARLAWQTNYSYKHFKYAILPELLSITECIDYDNNAEELIWICDDKARELAEREADALLEREQAEARG